MIIDTHVHMYDGGWPPESEPGLSAESMIGAMDEYGIEKVWISSTTGLVRDFAVYNKKLYFYTKLNPGRLIGFYTVNPNYPENVIDEIKRCAETYGGRGLKLHPWLQAFSTTYGIVGKVIEECIKYGLPILFHDGTPPYSDSLQVAHLAEIYPEAKIILGHSGLYDMYRSAISAAKRFENIYLCLCGTAIDDTRRILSGVDNGRILFGSDFGTSDVNIIRDRIDVVEYACSSEMQKYKVFYGNANTLLI